MVALADWYIITNTYSSYWRNLPALDVQNDKCLTLLVDPVGYADLSILGVQDKISRIEYGIVDWKTIQHDWCS